MCEVMEEASYVPHHKKKLAFVFSAMRHFAEALESSGKAVRYVQLDDPDNSGGFAGELQRALAAGDYDRVVITEPGEWRVMEMIHSWQDSLDVPVIVREDTRFFASLGQFERWADGKSNCAWSFSIARCAARPAI